MFRIGCHLSVSKGFYKACEVMNFVEGNTFQYFSRNPRGGAMKQIDLADIKKCNEYLKTIGNEQLLCHAPYTLNAASQVDKIRDFALMVFKEDLEFLSNFPQALYNFHPGSHVGVGVELGIKSICDILNKVLYEDLQVCVLLETMAGKGSEIGRSFEELKQIIDNVTLSDKLGVCLDTCHVYSAGYDIVNDLDGVLKHFDEVIGLDRLKAIHLNDSLMPFASNKDRHAKIGEGTIGIEAIKNIINHPLLKDVLFVLETPNELDGYKEEIALLKSLREE